MAYVLISYPVLLFTQFEYDAPLDQYNLSIKYLTPYGEEFESINVIQIEKGLLHCISFQHSSLSMIFSKKKYLIQFLSSSQCSKAVYQLNLVGNLIQKVLISINL